MSTPERTESLAEKVAWARWSAISFLSWEASNGKERMVAEAQEWLDAIQAAGLAVVELPEPDHQFPCDDFKGPGAMAPQWELPSMERLTAFDDGVEDDAGLVEDLETLRVSALKTLAAVAASERMRAERQGGDPR